MKIEKITNPDCFCDFSHGEDTIDERIYRCLMKKESLVDSFRREIEKQKDDKETLWRWLNSDQSWAKLKRKTRSA